MYSYMTLGFLLVGIFLASPQAALAYLDPGTGSFIFQIIIASLLAVAVSFKKVWLWFGKFFKKNKRLEDNKDVKIE